MVYMQREGSAALPATVESVNFPGRDEGPAAQVSAGFRDLVSLLYKPSVFLHVSHTQYTPTAVDAYT